MKRRGANDIIDDLHSYLDDIQYIDSISGRIKSKKSFITKVLSDQEKYNPPFQQIEDFIGIRILVYFRDTAKTVYDTIKEGFYSNVENIHKEPLNPNQFGYEGYHLIQSLPIHYLDSLSTFPDFPKVIEIQVKTLFMHAWSQPEHLIRYKNNKGIKELPANIERKLAWLAATSWGSDSVMLELKKWLES